jgi:VCBS repeat-containing protein
VTNYYRYYLNDANNDSLTVTHIQHSGAGSSTSVTNVTYNHGSATSVSGTYGTLTIGSDGSYQYVASSDINNLDAGEANVTDVFTYTVSDGNGGTDTETLTINVIPSQDLTARNDTGTVNEDATLTVVDGDNANSITTAATSYSVDDAESISDQETNAAGLAFSKDGLKMFHAGNDNDDIHEYTLTSAFDVSSASYVDSLDVSARDSRNFWYNF